MVVDRRVRRFVEVVLDVVFGDEMRNVGGSFDGEFATAIDGAEDEEGDFIDDAGVYKSFSLTFFGFGSRAGSVGDLLKPFRNRTPLLAQGDIP